MATTLTLSTTQQFNMDFAPAYQVCDFIKDHNIAKFICRRLHFLGNGIVPIVTFLRGDRI